MSATTAPKLLTLVKALTDAQKGDPLARAAMGGARNEFLPEDNKVMMNQQNPGVSPDLYDPQRFAPMNFDGSLQDIRGGASQALNPPPSGPGGPSSVLPVGKDRSSLGLLQPSAGTQNTGAGVHEQNEPMDLSGFDKLDAPEKRGSFWTSDAFTDRMQIAGSALLGAGIGKLTGLGGTAVGGYAGAAGVQDFQKKQQEQLARRHKLFEDVYGQVNALPAEIYTTPGMEGLAQAAEAVRKDMADGKVDNEKNLSLFLTEKAKYGTELSDIETNKKIEEQGKIQDALFQQDAQRKEQRAMSLRAILADPMAQPAEKEQAQAELFEIDKVRQEFQMRQANQQDEMRHRREMESQGRTGLGIQQSAINMRGQIAGQNNQARVGLAQTAQLNRNFQQELNNRVALAKASGEGMSYGDIYNDTATARKLELTQAAGIKMGTPGNLQMFGREVPLAAILGNDPRFWDAGGTPSELGWKKVFGAAMQQVQASPQPNEALGMSNLDGAYQ